MGGRIGYSLEKRWRDGTTEVVMTQEVLMERLCALVPRPRKHLVTYDGVLAPASGLRSRVVPRREGDAGEVGGCRHGDDAGAVAVASADLDEAVVAAGVGLPAVPARLRCVGADRVHAALGTGARRPRRRRPRASGDR
ncbi:MAG: transposase [Planctomycetes bacterium]|nr:transposase [Planctomycetota bacterium]